MIKTKQKIILREGVPVDIITNGDLVSTYALIGRANKQFNNIISLEAHRRGHFLPSVEINNGSEVNDLVTNESYIVVSLYSELIGGQKSSNVAHMLKCNALIDVYGEVKTADEDGNIKKEIITKFSDLRVYAQVVSPDLKQYDVGLYQDTEYLIYAPCIGINLLDRIILKVEDKQIPLKVNVPDYVSYPGLVVVYTCFETRK